MDQATARPTRVEVPTAAAIREHLGHPVIDADGHIVEYVPALRFYLREEGVGLRLESPFIPAQFPPLPGDDDDDESASGWWAAWYEMGEEERRYLHRYRPGWRGVVTRDTYDTATVMLPALLHRRMDELGIDYSIVYPTLGLRFFEFDNSDTRRGACRALNRYNRDVFDGLRDRLEPVGVVPMHTPEEALEELDYVVRTLGFKAVLLPSFVRRPVPVVADTAPQAAPYAGYLDTFGIDSMYDYDPVWRRCIELGVSPAMHSPTLGFGTRQSTSNYMFNHIGHFAAAAEAACKSLFMGGVTKRFPELRVALLEGGVNWAAGLYCDLISHWEKRNAVAIDRNYAPDNIDPDRFTDLFNQYAAPAMRKVVPQGVRAIERRAVHRHEVLDEFAACEINSPADIAEQLLKGFAFGCEADDPMTPVAFAGTLPMGAQLRAMFSSDIGHWDVPDLTAVLEEAWEPVAAGTLTADNFRDFTFTNAARFYRQSNPAFFEGTAVAAAARQVDIDNLNG
jgi:predicted TIM-barrel fold metal-dependent hydrolase